MSYREHGFKHGFLTALNRCVAASFFPPPLGRRRTEKKSPSAGLAPRPPKILARERYLAIPTFIRQGKTLTL